MLINYEIMSFRIFTEMFKNFICGAENICVCGWTCLRKNRSGKLWKHVSKAIEVSLFFGLRRKTKKNGRKPLCFFFFPTKSKTENVVFWLKQILNLKLYVFCFSPVCQPRKVLAFIQDPVVAQLFTHYECLEKLKQRYDRSQKLPFYDPT